MCNNGMDMTNYYMQMSQGRGASGLGVLGMLFWWFVITFIALWLSNWLMFKEETRVSNSQLGWLALGVMIVWIVFAIIAVAVMASSPQM